MCKLHAWAASLVLFCSFFLCRAQAGTVAADVPQEPAALAPAVTDPASDALSSAELKQAQENLAQVRAQVASGTRPQSDLEQAQERLADAQDEELLARTLYSGRSAQQMTTDDAQTMLAAAQRRVERQAKLVEAGRQEHGRDAAAKLKALRDELDARKRVLQLAEERAAEVRQIAAMADAEQAGDSDGSSAPNELETPMIRYDGDGVFRLRELRSIERSYEDEFHERLPVSAIGETRLHRRLGLNHTGRVDVALNPDGTEGMWLRQYLESRHIPYLAFRCAIRGAATAPHIHIGPESTRLRRARRSASARRTLRALR
jgi:hypothetical protein